MVTGPPTALIRCSPRICPAVTDTLFGVDRAVSAEQIRALALRAQRPTRSCSALVPPISALALRAQRPTLVLFGVARPRARAQRCSAHAGRPAKACDPQPTFGIGPLGNHVEARPAADAG